VGFVVKKVAKKYIFLFEVRHPRCVEPKLQNAKKYSQNTTIFISYEWVNHIAVIQ